MVRSALHLLLSMRTQSCFLPVLLEKEKLKELQDRSHTDTCLITPLSCIGSGACSLLHSIERWSMAASPSRLGSVPDKALKAKLSPLREESLPNCDGSAPCILLRET